MNATSHPISVWAETSSRQETFQYPKMYQDRRYRWGRGCKSSDIFWDDGKSITWRLFQERVCPTKSRISCGCARLWSSEISSDGLWRRCHRSFGSGNDLILGESRIVFWQNLSYACWEQSAKSRSRLTLRARYRNILSSRERKTSS